MNPIELIGLDNLNNSTLVLSVSTGVDSMVLLDLLLKKNYSVVVVHFNHNKREASVTEANYLKTYCEERNIPFEYFILNINQDNFQNEAHALRYKHLEDVAKKYHTPYILTAHHLNDLAETILMKLSRGSNLFGYAGMQPILNRHDNILIKPLLYEKKERLYEYAKMHDITYFEDHSNKEDTYTRNRFRNHIIPELIDENSQFLEKTKQFSNLVSEASNYITKQAKPYLEKDRLNLREFNQLDTIIKKTILGHKFEMKNIEITNQKLEDSINFLSNTGPNQSLDLSKDYILQVTYHLAEIKHKTAHKPFKMELMLDSLNILPNMGYITFLKEQFNSSYYEIKLCYNKLALPLYVRNRQPGDMLYFPYGRKKLKDFYIDKKIPKHLRETDLIITDKNDQILAVLGRYYNRLEENNEELTLVYKRGI